MGGELFTSSEEARQKICTFWAKALRHQASPARFCAVHNHPHPSQLRRHTKDKVCVGIVGGVLRAQKVLRVSVSAAVKHAKVTRIADGFSGASVAPCTVRAQLQRVSTEPPCRRCRTAIPCFPTRPVLTMLWSPSLATV